MSKNEAMTITEFLEARIAEDEKHAARLLKDLEDQVAEEYAGEVDERGPFTPRRLLGAQMWAQYDGQSKRRSFAKGQQIAYLANPARVLAERAAKRAILAFDQDEQIWDPRGFSSDTASEAFTRGGPKNPQSRHVTRLLAAVYKDHPDYEQEWDA